MIALKTGKDNYLKVTKYLFENSTNIISIKNFNYYCFRGDRAVVITNFGSKTIELGDGLAKDFVKSIEQIAQTEESR